MTDAGMRDPDTCAGCETPFALSNRYGAFRCAECGQGWRVVPYSAWACLLCSGATGGRVGRERVWMTCTGCTGSGMDQSPRGAAGLGGSCHSNSGGPHNKIRIDGPRGEKWHCVQCKVRW